MNRTTMYTVATLILFAVTAYAVSTFRTTIVYDFENGAKMKDIQLQNGETIVNDLDGQFDFTRDTAGAVAIRASDDDSTAALQILPGGAATLTLGGGSATSITLVTDGTGTGEVVLPADSISLSENSNMTIGAAPAATCEAGSIHVDTDETDDTNCTTTADNAICVCSATDTWVSLQ